jgi:regulator of protease activity HflC (stomatin/prohibitin superfamily)
MDEEMKQVRQVVRSVVIGVVVLLGLIVFFGSWFVVDVGTVGVKFNTVSGKTASYQQGFHFKLPLLENITKFDVKTQRLDEKAVGASKDLQEVTFELALNYRLVYDKVNELYVKVGRDYQQKVIIPAVNEIVKASASKFPVEQIIVNREVLKTMIEETLTKKLETYDIVVENVNIMDIDFTPEFNKVVEAKQIEEQKIKTAEYQKRQAEELKQKTIFEAEGEARKQQLLRESVSEKVISLKWIEKWDGKLPQIIAGDKGGMLLNIPAKGKDE